MGSAYHLCSQGEGARKSVTLLGPGRTAQRDSRDGTALISPARHLCVSHAATPPPRPEVTTLVPVPAVRRGRLRGAARGPHHSRATFAGSVKSEHFSKSLGVGSLCHGRFLVGVWLSFAKATGHVSAAEATGSGERAGDPAALR